MNRTLRIGVSCSDILLRKNKSHIGHIHFAMVPECMRDIRLAASHLFSRSRQTSVIQSDSEYAIDMLAAVLRLAYKPVHGDLADVAHHAGMCHLTGVITLLGNSSCSLLKRP